MQLNLSVNRPRNTVKMDALVGAVPACDVAKVAADTLLLIDPRDDFVIQIEMLPIGDAIE